MIGNKETRRVSTLARFQPWLLIALTALCSWLFLTRHASREIWTREEIKAAVATGNGVVVTRAAFEEATLKNGVPPAQDADSQQSLKALVDGLVDQELLAQEAQTRGLEKRPGVREKINRAMADALMTDELAALTYADVSVDSVAAYYEAHQSEYSRPEAVRLAQLFFKSAPDSGESGREAARKRAQAALERARNYRARSLSFGDLANELSDDDATKHKGGDLGEAIRGDERVDSRLIDAAFALSNIGEVSGLVESEEGFHIVRLTGRRPAFERRLEEADEEIRGKLLAEMRVAKYQGLLEFLRARGNVVIHEDLLDVNGLLVPKSSGIAVVPPALPDESQGVR